MKTPIATIETEIGTMTVYFNGIGKDLTAEKDDIVEELNYTSSSLRKALDAVYAMYSSNPEWDLTMLVEED